jgi:hypothetical protein
MVEGSDDQHTVCVYLVQDLLEPPTVAAIIRMINRLGIFPANLPSQPVRNRREGLGAWSGRKATHRHPHYWGLVNRPFHHHHHLHRPCPRSRPGLTTQSSAGLIAHINTVARPHTRLPSSFPCSLYTITRINICESYVPRASYTAYVVCESSLPLQLLSLPTKQHNNNTLDRRGVKPSISSQWPSLVSKHSSYTQSRYFPHHHHQSDTRISSQWKTSCACVVARSHRETSRWKVM